MNKKKQHIFFALYLLLLFLPLFELGARIIGYRPYQQIPFSLESTPDFCLIPHSERGFALHPGRFQVKVNEGLEFGVTHDEDSNRITSFQADSIKRPELWIMGCSYTYGFGVNDGLTYPFLLQKKQSDYKVKNLAVPGFGNLQSLMQLEKAVASGRIPERVIVNYAHFHDDRNILAPTYRRDLYMGFLRSNDQLKDLMTTGEIPFFEENNGTYIVKQENWSTVFKPWKGSEDWASINFFQVISGEIALLGVDKRAATVEIFKRMKTLCDKNEIKFIVAGLTDHPMTHDMLAILSQEKIETLNISLDLTDSTYNHLPYDSHPNGKAHAYFATQVSHFISLN